jgi:tRNA threonylcarbamoyladenosine biosynthesis protein TsaE
MEQVIERPSQDATAALGERLARLLAPHDFVALDGDLGAGKTFLVKAVARALGAAEATSPTFAIVNVYPGGRILLHHLDLYRIAGPAELFALGFDDLLAEPAATFCEWAERGREALPDDRLAIALDVVTPEARRARCTATGPRSRALLSGIGR